ncbi:UxaA family hydrolase [Acidicapsa dinghuensis]|uniref:UxaA family hydrolase n=1 Tax=Acidicapsa dinghuensis TaxID=2218256 RepID=A0ABW1EDT1_9BACT|nr:altronate dehydratase family protein [Acidicapsa dinghuensis]
MTAPKAIQLDHRDNVLVALADLPAGSTVSVTGTKYSVTEAIPAKQKFAIHDFPAGAEVIMYGVIVGRVRHAIPRGGLLTTANVTHEAAGFHSRDTRAAWRPPDVARWTSRTFDGYHRSDGQVGTRNYWIVLPMVFCENRNVKALQEAFEEELGYGRPTQYRDQVRALLSELHGNGSSSQSSAGPSTATYAPVFKNIDGIKFITHQGGCGGTREDSGALCGLLAGYIHHPNVAGATVLSLGCQHAQVADMLDELKKRDPALSKPVLVFDQQKSGKESEMLAEAIRATFQGLVEANKIERKPAPLSKLTVGLKCGGSDGFSGISANPALGYVSDMLAVLGGSTLLSEFPELCGVEQSLINRCVDDVTADRFIQLMRSYEARAKAVHSGFEMNPSPGNIRDGLLTDAMKSAGAARKGGTSPVNDVLDYPEYVRKPGLTLQCTPGNDVECVTGQVGAGATVVLFTTGLGTPTGNPIAPVIKLATNTKLAERMPDIIDIDTGPIIEGTSSIPSMADQILELIVSIASGKTHTKAEGLRQDDFIPWKRGVSL